MKKGNLIINIIVNCTFYLCVMSITFVCLQIFFFSSFRIPSESMSPSLITGDYVLVFKPILGSRLFNCLPPCGGNRGDIYRAPGFRKLRHNDVVVFNYPHPHNWNRIEMYIMKYYIKRCIGLPGDSLLRRKTPATY
jgi:signal peptidase I